MVETPSAAITVSPSSEPVSDESKTGLLETGPTLTLVHQKPITSSIRGTTRHLVSIAGGWSRWRGIKLHALHGICFSVVASMFEAIVPNVPGRVVFVTGLAGALVANLHATWTHKVISQPTQKSFFQRLVTRSNWKVLALPAAIQASVGYLAIYIGQALVYLLGLDRVSQDNLGDYNGAQWTSVVLRSVTIAIVWMACALFVVLPALVTLVRIEASILPEDQDTIVPFDRTFAGKVVPKVIGGTGAIGFLDAWKSFNWEARGRLIKLYLKIFAIVTAFVVVASHVIVFEAWVIMGPSLGKFLAEARRESSSMS